MIVCFTDYGHRVIIFVLVKYAIRTVKSKTLYKGERIAIQMDNSYTYIVECRDGSLYTGWTNDIVKRIENHNNGSGAKYTRSRLPVRLVYYEVYSTKREAMQREYAIKQLTKADKQALILQNTTEELKMQCKEVNKQLDGN